jgi:hypothetical protein
MLPKIIKTEKDYDRTEAAVSAKPPYQSPKRPHHKDL